MKALTAPNLLFQSFRHSQGNFAAQLSLLEIVRRETGIEVSLSPSEKEMQRYLGYITGTRAQHLSYQDVSGKNGARETIDRTFTSLRTAYEEGSEAMKARADDHHYAVIASNLLMVELAMLNPYDSWKNLKDGETERRTTRLARRIASGKSSFLYYYGRDAQPTGSDVFDTMYAHIWQIVAHPADNVPPHHSDLLSTIGSLANLLPSSVEQSEIKFLGHTVLA